MTYPKGYTPPNPYHVDNFLEINYYEDGNIQSARINPWSFVLNHGEALLWDYASNTKGIIRKKVIARMVVTNFRAFVTDEENRRVDGYALLPGIDDVIVMNTRRVSNSIGYAVYAGRYGGFAGPRFSSGTSKTIGDLVFVINGQQSTWGNIPDPNGLKSFIKSIKKTMYDPLTKLQTKSKPARSGMICPQCGVQNPKNAQFCSGCGSQLLQMCSNCKQRNPIDASFCNKCGSQLSISYIVPLDKPTLSDKGYPIFSDKGDSELVEPSFLECLLPEYSVKINYPSTWTRRDDASDPCKVVFQSPIERPTDRFQDSLSICVDDTFGNMTPQNLIEANIPNLTPQYFIELNIANLKQSHSDFTLIESTPTTLSGGVPAHQIVYLADNLKILVVATVRNNVFYWLQYSSKPEAYLKFLSSVEQMISSFEILN